jgi:transposase
VEAFAWRTFRNTGQVGASMGLAPTPYQSGTSQHEQGISKAGNRHVRALAIEAAWAWVRYQPQSALTRWFHRRFGDAGPGARKKGIVAMARKLMIALWKYVQHDELPEGALLKT